MTKPTPATLKNQVNLALGRVRTRKAASKPANTIFKNSTHNPGVREAWSLVQRLLKTSHRKYRSTLKTAFLDDKTSHLNLGSRKVFTSPLLTGDYRERWVTFEPWAKRSEIRNSCSTTIQTKSSKAYHAQRMKAWLQFITAPTSDTPGTTLLLHFDNRRYLIGNISEGTQRACVQQKISLTKVTDIFLTGTLKWQTTGGILGMILTLADAISSRTAEANKVALEKNNKKSKAVIETKNGLTIHGGKNLTHLLATARRFVFRKGMPVDTNEFTNADQSMQLQPTWEDSNIRVWAMTISPSSAPSRSRKRSHEVMLEDGNLTDTATPRDIKTKEEEDRDFQLRKGVVGHMFGSDWRLDSLKKIRLSDVQMPATVFVRKGGHIEKYQGPLPGTGESLPDMEVLVRTPWPGASVASLPSTIPSSDAISYIIKSHTQRGRFDPKEAKRLGVKPGPDFGKLTSGKSVTTDEGKVVTAAMVLGADKEGCGFAVVDLPTNFHIDGFINRDEWSAKELMDGIESMVWILGDGVINDPRITAFMEKHQNVHHLVSSTDVCPNRLALDSAAAAAIRLHQIDPERFPVPVHSNNVSSAATSTTFDQVQVGAMIQLAPTSQYKTNDIVGNLDTAAVINETPKAVLLLSEEAQMKVNDPAYQAKLDERENDLPSKDAEVITLGTGSALPSKYRNVSATLLRVPGYGNYLFDCGENTLGQLKRVFGAELPQILRDLKVIWISHLHADHHLGTAAVINAWHDETRHDEETSSSKLIVASEASMLDWLQEYSEVEDYGYQRLYPIAMNKFQNEVSFSDRDTREYGLHSIIACPVSHCRGALAVAFQFPNGLKVAYSGDCRPSNEFVRIGQGATLLIHEATFDDELQGDAEAKKHSTTSEALSIGRRMGARRILLTHFSQRYPKIPIMNSEQKDQVAIVAFDYMRCMLKDFPKLAEFTPALLKLYEEDTDQDSASLGLIDPVDDITEVDAIITATA